MDGTPVWLVMPSYSETKRPGILSMHPAVAGGHYCRNWTSWKSPWASDASAAALARTLSIAPILVSWRAIGQSVPPRPLAVARWQSCVGFPIVRAICRAIWFREHPRVSDASDTFDFWVPPPRSPGATAIALA